jgi:hypothetical protein
MCGTLNYISPAMTFASVWAPFTVGLLAALPLAFRAITRPTLANHFSLGSIAIPVTIVGVVAISMLGPYGFVHYSYYMFDWPTGEQLYQDLWAGTRNGITAFATMLVLAMGPGGFLGTAIWMLRNKFSKRVLGCEAHRPAELPKDTSAGTSRLRTTLLVCSVIGWLAVAAVATWYFNARHLEVQMGPLMVPYHPQT